MKANDFVTGVANKKRHLRSSQRLPWSSRMGWQVVSTTIFDDSWIFDWRCDARRIYLSRAIKMKANDFVTGVANKKRRLRSSRWLPWSSRTGWQVVSTTIFNDSWIFDWRCDAWQIYLSRAIKKKANDFMTGVANEKRCSSRQLLWTSRTGWQVVSTTIFNDSWIFDWRCGQTIASLQQITCS